MQKKYLVGLTSEERKQLAELVKNGKTAGHKIRYAQMLLKVHQGKKGPGWADSAVAVEAKNVKGEARCFAALRTLRFKIVYFIPVCAGTSIVALG